MSQRASIALVSGILSATALSSAYAAPKWEGWYVGAHGSYAKHHSDASFDLEGDGFGGGVLAGYQFDLDGYILGVEADVNGYDLKSDDIFFSGKTATDQLNAVAALRLKAGIKGDLPIAGESLLYGTLGVAFGEWKASAYVPPLGDPPVIAEQFRSSRDWRTGLQFGAGVEVPLGDQLFFKTEVLHTDYEEITPFDVTFIILPLPVAYDERVNEVRVGLTWRF